MRFHRTPLRVWTEFTRHVQSWLDSVADAPSTSQFTVDITNSGGGHDLVLLDGPGMLGCIEVSDAHVRGSRAYHCAFAASSRRRGDRMSAFTSEIGSNRTCRGGLTMSVYRGRPEVIGARSK